MNPEILIRTSFAQAASCLEELLKLVMRNDQGFLATLSADPPPRDRMRFHAKGGPDAYLRLPPLAKEAVLVAWHSNHRDAYYRCAKARLSAVTLDTGRGEEGADPAARGGEGCRLTWDPADIRIDFIREWQAMLQAASNVLPVEPCAPLQCDPVYLPPVVVAETHLYTGLPDLDTATKQRLDTVFAPGFLRYERIAEEHEGGDLVRYRIRGDLHDGGDFGEIWIRVGGREWTSVILCALELDQRPLPAELREALALPPEAHPVALAKLHARYAAARNDRLRSKAEYLKMVWEGYGRSLPPHWLSPFRADTAEKLARSASRVSETEETVLAQWCSGRTASEIAAGLGLKPAYITNMITRLRKRLGPDIVPLRRPDLAS